MRVDRRRRCSPSSSRVSRSILRIASSSVPIASCRSAICASRKVLRSRDALSSSSAARLTAPSAAISRLMRSISPCRPQQLDRAVGHDLRASASRSTCAAVSCSRYCAPPSCAACSSSCSLTIASRSGCRLRSKPRRCSSARAQLALQLVVGAALRAERLLALELAAPARVCSPACVRRVGQRVELGAQLRRRLLVGREPAAAAVSMARCSSARRAASERDANCASCAWRSSARSCSRAAASARSAAITASSSSAWRSCSRRRAAGRAPRSAPRRSRGARPAPRAARRSRRVRSSSWSRRACVACGLLGQAQQFDLQLVRARLRLGGLAARLHQPLRGLGAGGLDAHQRRCAPRRRSAPGRAAAAVEVLDLLRPRQHAGLLGIGRVEADREGAHRMAVAAS